MENHKTMFEAVDKLRADGAAKQKRGLHFIAASVLVWIAILFIHMSDLSIEQKNLFTFFCSAPLMPIAYFISKLIKADFSNKSNPLTNLGILFSVNQMLYILIAMWVYSSVPDKMLMVYAMIFGAHLLPFGWLYRSKSYYVLSVLIPIVVLLLGIFFATIAVAGFMVMIEIIFCIALIIENKVSKH